MHSTPAQNLIAAAVIVLSQWANETAAGNASLDPDKLIEWDLPRMRLYELADTFSRRYEVQIAVDTSNAYVGPVKGVLSPKQLWKLLAEATCGTFHMVDDSTYGIRPRIVPPLNDRAFDYRIPRDKLDKVLRYLGRQSNGLTIVYLPTSNEEQNREVGPYNGHWTPLDALMKILAEHPELTFRWVDPGTISVEPKAQVPPEQDLIARGLAGDICRVTVPPSSDRMLVTAARWPSFAEATSPTIIDRRHIEDSGKDNLPDVLQQLSQNAFHRGVGYRGTGTQCAVLRGVAPVKVLINGRPTFGSAADFFDDCVDLNSIPLSAVERIEASPDAVSFAHGADALGGAINLVLRTEDTQAAEARYQGARGGAGVLHTSVIAGASDDSWLTSLVLDYSDTSSLQGAERERWSDQDFRRFGGQDYRSSFSSPPNLSAVAGNLPGLNSSTAAVRVTPTGALDIAAGEQNRSSLFAWQDIVPDIRRMNISAIAEREIGTTLLTSEFLLADRSVTHHFGPELIPGLLLGAGHYQNTFGMPVSVHAALTGLPLPRDEVNSTLARGALQIDGRWSKLHYSIYALHSKEDASITSKNLLDYGALADSLFGQTVAPLNVLTDKPGRGGEHILSPPSTTRSDIGGTILSASLRSDLFMAPGGAASTHVGAEFWREFADYGNVTAKLHRQIASGYGIFQLPLAEEVKATIGARLDKYEQLDAVTSYQYSLEWRPLRRLSLSGSYSDTFAAPRMFDLHTPVQSFTTPIFDPSWGELVSVAIVAGGNEHLGPTIGRSSTVGLAYGAPEDPFIASVDLWSVSLKDRVGLVHPQLLLAHEDTALEGRVIRDLATPDDEAAGRRGRLRTLDLRRANFGSTETRGVDASISGAFNTGSARVTSRLDITYTDDFRYAELPSINDPGRQRTGVADVLGTMTRWRLRGWLQIAMAEWNVNVLARWNSCYQDVDPALVRTNRSVCPGPTIDLNVSKEIGEHFEVTLGSSDVFDHSPSFSEVFGAAGVDLSQEDLVGRTAFLAVTFRL